MRNLLMSVLLLLSCLPSFSQVRTPLTTNTMMNAPIDGFTVIWNNTAQKWSNATLTSTTTNVPAYVLTNSETKNVTLLGWVDVQAPLTNRGSLFVTTNITAMRDIFGSNNVYAGNNLTSATFNVGTSLQLGAATNRGPIGIIVEGSGNGGFYATAPSGIAGGYIGMTYSGGGFISSDSSYTFLSGLGASMFDLRTNTSLFPSNLQVNGNLIANFNLNLPQQTPLRVAVINGSGNVVSDGNISITELQALDNITVNIQTAIDGKVDELNGVSTNQTSYGTHTMASVLLVTGKQTNQQDLIADSGAQFRVVNGPTEYTTYGEGILSSLNAGGPFSIIVDERVTINTNLNVQGVALMREGSISNSFRQFNVTASRAAIYDPNGYLTNASGTPDGTKFLRDDGTYAVPPGGAGGTPGGATPMMQMNMGGAFVGTTNLVYDVTNNKVGLNIPSGRPLSEIDIGGTQPGIQLRGTTPAYTNAIYPTGLVFRAFAGANAPGIYNNEGAYFASYLFGTNTFFCSPGGSADLGSVNAPWRTLYVNNLNSAGAFALTPNNSTQLGTNNFADGSRGSLFTNVFNSVTAGITNLYTTNMTDGQTIHWWLYPSNGVTVTFPQFTSASQYTDGAVVTPMTNQWSHVEITKRGTETNITVITATFALLNGNAITSSTNFVTKEITLNATRVGVYRTVYIDAAAMVSNTTAGATFLTEQSATPTNRMVDSYVFDGTSSNYVQFKFAMPLEWDLGTVKVKLWTWTTNNIATVTNVYGIAATAIKDATVLTNADWGTEVTITNVVSSAGGAVQLTQATLALTVGNTPAAAGNLVWWRVRRIPQNSNDNDGGQSKVLGAWVQYKELTTEPASW